MLINSLKNELNAAVKSGDTTRRDTLRFLLSAIGNAAIAKYGSEAEKKLTDADVLDVIKKQVKTHKESIEAFEKGSRADLAQKEKAELVILEAYLPKQMSDEELRKLLEPIMKTGEKNFGLLMGQAMSVVSGRADGARVAAILKEMV